MPRPESRKPELDPIEMPERIRLAAVRVCGKDAARLESMLARLLAAYRGCGEPGCKGCEVIARTAQSVERELEALRPAGAQVPEVERDDVAADVRR